MDRIHQLAEILAKAKVRGYLDAEDQKFVAEFTQELAMAMRKFVEAYVAAVQPAIDAMLDWYATLPEEVKEYAKIAQDRPIEERKGVISMAIWGDPMPSHLSHLMPLPQESRNIEMGYN